MKFISIILLSMCCMACQSTYNASQLYNPTQLKSDFEVMKTALQAGHPSLYWYSPKDSIAVGFAKTLAKLDKPLTEIEYRRALEESVRLINCGQIGRAHV